MGLQRAILSRRTMPLVSYAVLCLLQRTRAQAQSFGASVAAAGPLLRVRAAGETRLTHAIVANHRFAPDNQGELVLPLGASSSAWFDLGRIDISFQVGNRARTHSFIGRKFSWLSNEDSFSVVINCQNLPTRRSSVEALQRRVFTSMSVGLSDYFDAIDLYERFDEGASKASSFGLLVRNALRLGTLADNQFFGFDPWPFDEASEQAGKLGRFAPEAWQREVLRPMASPLKHQYQYNHFSHAIAQLANLRRQRSISAGLQLIEEVFNSYQQHQLAERADIDRVVKFAWEENLRFFQQASTAGPQSPPR
jgi:hypothetical protein